MIVKSIFVTDWSEGKSQEVKYDRIS